MKKNTIVVWGQYPGNFETKFFPLRFEGILYNSVGLSRIFPNFGIQHFYDKYTVSKCDGCLGKVKIWSFISRDIFTMNVL